MSVCEMSVELTVLYDLAIIQIEFSSLEDLNRDWHGLVRRLRRGDAAECQRRYRQDWNDWFGVLADVSLLQGTG
jgi:uncharacterized protein involved in type VI secretion and phage assembly